MSDLSQFRDHAARMATAEHKPECPHITARKPSPPPCSGCITDADRALWQRLAGEANAYLTDDHEAGLFA